MLRFILKRLLLGIPTLVAVLTIIFLLMRVVPGDPAYAVLGDYATDDAVSCAPRADGSQPADLATVPDVHGRPLAR